MDERTISLLAHYLPVVRTSTDINFVEFLHIPAYFLLTYLSVFMLDFIRDGFSEGGGSISYNVYGDSIARIFHK